MTVTPDPYFSNPVQLGFVPNDPGGSSLSLTLNTATTFLAIGFSLPAGKTINTFELYCSAIVVTGGALTGANHTLNLESDSSGAPSGSITETHALSSAPTATTWMTWSGFTTVLSADTQYWLVIKNAETLPATQNATWQLVTGLQAPQGNSSGAVQGGSFGYSAKYCIDGSTWTSGGSGYVPALGWKIGFSDGTYIGVPINQGLADTADPVYSSNETGVQFTIPSLWPTINISDLWFFVSNAGTSPAGGLRYRIYTGGSPALQGTSQTIPTVNYKLGWNHAHFDTPVAVAPNTVLTFTLGAVSGGDSSNYFRPYYYPVENSASSASLMPFGNIKSAYYNGSTWSTSALKFIPFSMQLANGNEFTVAASGGLFRPSIEAGA